MEPFTAAIIIVIASVIFWRFVLGIPLGVAYRCPACNKLLTKLFTYRVERCPHCNLYIDWEQLMREEYY